jgi:hypothetical protein
MCECPCVCATTAASSIAGTAAASSATTAVTTDTSISRLYVRHQNACMTLTIDLLVAPLWQNKLNTQSLTANLKNTYKTLEKHKRSAKKVLHTCSGSSSRGGPGVPSSLRGLHVTVAPKHLAALTVAAHALRPPLLRLAVSFSSIL